MVFKSQKVLTGIVQRVSKKSGEPYVILNFLNEEGETFSCMYKGVELPSGQFKQLDVVDVTFFVRTGKYLNLEVTSIEKV